jgi:hypothetical protein
MTDLKQALKNYCNWSTDLAELAGARKVGCADDILRRNELKRQIHEYMQAQHIDCLYNEKRAKFVYRAVRKNARPLSEDMQSLILEEIGKAEREGKLQFVDTEMLILDVIRLIQQTRTASTETLKVSDKKPSTIGDAVVPTIPAVAAMMSTYLDLEAKLCRLDAAVKQVKDDLTARINEVKPIVAEYCKARSVIKKPMDFNRRMSSSFSKCIVEFDPTYFSRVRRQKARRFLQYKQSRSRNRKVTTLRPSKKHMTETLEMLTRQKTTGWTHVKIVKQLFKTLYDEAEQTIAKKLEENESNPVFKVSLTGMSQTNE